MPLPPRGIQEVIMQIRTDIPTIVLYLTILLAGAVAGHGVRAGLGQIEGYGQTQAWAGR